MSPRSWAEGRFTPALGASMMLSAWGGFVTFA
jgi:hypothetical protein